VNCWLAENPTLRVLNGYGPTEVTINAVSYTITSANRIQAGAYPIGRPMTGVGISLVDELGKEIVDANQAGELWLSGTQVMTGYYAMPQETQRFICHHAGIRYYKTGDLCEYDANGNLVYVGRLDNEVKLEGKRIHLGEIQNQLLRMNHIRHASLGVVNIKDRKYIASVLFADLDLERVNGTVRSLSGIIPDWMMPKVWAIAHTPIQTASGKTNDRLMIAQLQATENLLPHKFYAQNQQGKYELLKNENVQRNF
jgi:long-subunit acyl-CoA synthetase (AMP-forming)